jgi:hypothetical protein
MELAVDVLVVLMTLLNFEEVNVLSDPYLMSQELPFLVHVHIHTLHDYLEID